MRRWLKEIKREEYIEYYIRFDYIIDKKEADKELKMEEFKNAFLSYFLSKNISKDYLIDDDKNICISNISPENRELVSQIISNILKEKIKKII